MTAAEELHPGHLVGSRYRVEGVVDRGGMGVVYSAIDEQLRRPVALKLLSAETQADADRLRRFGKEALTLSALNHPHIVTVYEVGQAGDTPFIAMELVDGHTLGTRLRVGPLPLREALEVGVQVARALAAAHAKGIVHRDIKPDNLMLRADGYVKVLDFGIAELRPQPAPGESILARATSGDATLVVAGTPAYMSPEQIAGAPADARSDLFSLGVTLCEALTGSNPFERPGMLDTLTTITHTPSPAEPALVPLPKQLRTILRRLLQKNPADRYANATALATDLQAMIRALDGGPGRIKRWQVAAAALALFAATAAAVTEYRLAEQRRWAREQAIPQIASLTKQERYARAWPLIETAEHYLAGDPALEQVVAAATRTVSIQSSPPGATIEIKDYSDPSEPWLALGVTPLTNVRIPTGYLRFRVSKAGLPETVTAPFFAATVGFDLVRAAKAPARMVPVDGGPWGDYSAFLGVIGASLPPFFIDRYEVTNREYQSFVDQGGYANPAYWKQPFVREGRTLTFGEAMAVFRDSTGRAGPATWEGGHYPEGKADYPVTGVSWFEAAAYAEFAGKTLPVVAQFGKTAPNALDRFISPLSNNGEEIAPAGKFDGLGPYGTYDLVGNVREWYWNSAGTDLRFLLGRLPSSYAPEALSPFDRSTLNGFRCVVNEMPLPEAARAPITLLKRDFSKVKPVGDDVFAAYRTMYTYDKTPLDAVVEPAPDASESWTREKITFNTAYGRERMAAYLFKPARMRPPYQTIVFFPSARVNRLPDSRNLGDVDFLDYVVKSGRAVLYPIYQYLYERQQGVPPNPGPTLGRDVLIAWSKDLGRSIDYLESRPDIDTRHFGYLGVSQGAADGVILAALEDRLKAVVLLDGGFFQHEHPVPGTDQVDFAPRMTKPALMVNGRYDWTFPLQSSQTPMFEMLGTPAADKRHVVFDTPHDVRFRRDDLVREVLAWYDKYLGKVE
jgi:formylglycine-generating enzyme required for sulfatase activity/dienelactone hydrolase